MSRMVKTGKPVPQPVTKALRKALLASGKTQMELAELAGMSQPSVRSFMLGESSTTVDNAAKLAAAINYKLELLKPG